MNRKVQQNYKTIIHNSTMFLKIKTQYFTPLIIFVFIIHVISSCVYLFIVLNLIMIKKKNCIKMPFLFALLISLHFSLNHNQKLWLKSSFILQNHKCISCSMIVWGLYKQIFIKDNRLISVRFDYKRLINDTRIKTFQRQIK